ncbi:unnamed protein product [Hyaloperonospora brassicae]|uniref:Uncharacterized protein n=1 Tax=Hyaloperonospora brassicae TaxID=162125 RepID=A0AAV0UKM3_HYABA|nr:unnamed protein product [Hyaloperonospora brassicae]
MTGRKSAVPWRTWTEWQDVREGLFSRDLYAQQRSIARVAAWRSRMQLPVAVNATAQLAELQLHEAMAQHHHHAVGVSSRSHMELSLLYANVVVRCVNGLVDGSQRGAYAMAVSTLAQRIGIPLWVVDLRHESTHNQLPSLSVLRFAARHLLAWLRVNYWGAQEELIREQVQHVAQWLLAQLPHLHREPRSDEEQVELRLEEEAVEGQTMPKLRLDVENLRNIVGPLLVNGEHFRERVAPCGLFFLTASVAVEGQEVRDAVDVFQEELDAAVALLLRLQPLWRSFSALLLATLCHKVFDDLCSPTSRCSSEDDSGQSIHGKQDEHTFGTNEMEMTLQWIKFMASSEYREKVKLQIGPVEDLCHCGAEMLVLAERLKSDGVASGRTELLERLLAALRFSRAVRNHPLLATEAAIATSLASQSASGWTQLPAWAESPIGLRYRFTPSHALNQHQVREYAFDDDSLTSDTTTFVAPDDDVEAQDANTSDVDAVMEDLDAAYMATLQRIVTLQATIARDGLRQGGSTTVLPKLELQRIQEEIEIW